MVTQKQWHGFIYQKSFSLSTFGSGPFFATIRKTWPNVLLNLFMGRFFLNSNVNCSLMIFFIHVCNGI